MTRDRWAPIDRRTAISLARKATGKKESGQVRAGDEEQRSRYRHKQMHLCGIVRLIVRRFTICRG